MPKQQGQKTSRKTRTKDKPYSRSTQDGLTSSDNLEEPPSICPVCDEIVKEPSEDGKDPGDEALYCEGKCEAWYHRKCVGLSKCAYDLASESENPFYCLFCMQTHYNNIILKLKDQINKLISKPNQLAAVSNHAHDQQPTDNASYPISLNPVSSNAAVTSIGDQQTLTSIPVSIPRPVTTASTKSDPARKFNVVLFGLAECPKGTKKPDRDQLDLNNATKILSELDNSLQPFSFRDAIRLGKYNPTGRTRPLLVTLNRSSDVTIILSKRAGIKSPYTVKADLSKEARDTESYLLKIRWSLIQANTPKSDIKIRGNKLYLKGKLYGQADSTGFRPVSIPNSRATPAPRDDTTMDTSTPSS